VQARSTLFPRCCDGQRQTKPYQSRHGDRSE
jgi:hypothetical protein